MGASIERRGVESVLQGYALVEATMYSVWAAKELKFTYTGTDDEEALRLLNENLQAIEHSGSVQIYTIRFHTETDSNGYISNKTNYVGSFNFKMTEREGYRAGVGSDVVPYSGGYGNAAILQKLEQMQSEIVALKQQQRDDEEDYEEPSVWDRVGAVANNLLDQPFVQNIIMNIFGAKKEPSIAGVPGNATPTDQDKINYAIQVLYKQDPDFANNILKLASLAIDNPAKYKMATTFL